MEAQYRTTDGAGTAQVQGLGGIQQQIAQLLQNEDIRGIAAQILNTIADGNRSLAITEALIATGLAENPQKLRALESKHSEVLEQYFEQIDTEALLTKIAGAAGEGPGGPGMEFDPLSFAGGGITGALLQSLLSD